MNKPQNARRNKTDSSPNPVLLKEALRLILISNSRPTTKLSVPESALSATSGHIAYMRQASDVIVIIPDGWTNDVCMYMCMYLSIYRVYVCVCKFVWMYVCMHVCICVHVSKLYECMYVFMCVYACMWVCMCVCMYVCMYVCLFECNALYIVSPFF